jgi:hypothetical protein
MGMVGARSAPFGGGNELKKTGARSARARTRGKNPLVCEYSNNFEMAFVLLSRAKRGK